MMMSVIMLLEASQLPDTQWPLIAVTQLQESSSNMLHMPSSANQIMPGLETVVVF